MARQQAKQKKNMDVRLRLDSQSLWCAQISNLEGSVGAAKEVWFAQSKKILPVYTLKEKYPADFVFGKALEK
jgi:hypothetical protein